MPFLQPELATRSFDILPGMTIADFGCGSGHWALLLAKLVGPSGKVYAFDVQESALEATRSQAKLAHMYNIEGVRTDLEQPHGSTLKDACVDMVVLSNILFQVESKETIVKEAARVVKPGGKAIVIEWDETESLTGPPIAQRITRQETERLFLQQSFRFEKECNAGSQHYGFVFKKI